VLFQQLFLSDTIFTNMNKKIRNMLQSPRGPRQDHAGEHHAPGKRGMFPR